MCEVRESPANKGRNAFSEARIRRVGVYQRRLRVEGRAIGARCVSDSALLHNLKKETEMKLKVQPTKSQLADLKRLAEAMNSAGEAKALTKRLASFRDDNAEALSGEGVEIDGLSVRVKITRELIVEAA